MSFVRFLGPEGLKATKTEKRLDEHRVAALGLSKGLTLKIRENAATLCSSNLFSVFCKVFRTRGTKSLGKRHTRVEIQSYKRRILLNV